MPATKLLIRGQNFECSNALKRPLIFFILKRDSWNEKKSLPICYTMNHEDIIGAKTCLNLIWNISEPDYFGHNLPVPSKFSISDLK